MSNRNNIITETWSNDASRRMYEAGWPEEPLVARQHENGDQCGGCSFYAKFNLDYGLCGNTESRHHTETVFEHFTCPSFVNDGWGPHSFTKNSEYHCHCGSEPEL
jgi:hypothetical protein